LPHSLDAERALLGSLLLEDTAISEAIAALEGAGSDVFWLGRHQQLYELILSLWKDNQPIDGVVIKDELVRRGQFEQLGGYEFLASLIDSVPSTRRVREYARIVLEKYLLRQLINATHYVVEAAFNQSESAQQVLDFAEQTIFDVTERRVSGGPQMLPDLITQVFERIQDLDGKSLTGLPTGFTELDDLTCGLQPSELIIIAGRPSMGKTALGVNIAEHMAMTEGLPVLFFSLEMSSQQVAQRIMCSRAGVNSERLRKGQHSSADLSRLQQVADEARNRPLLVDDTASLSILELRARARMAYRKHAIRAVFVDYLQLMHAPGSENRQQEVAAISRGLKALAKELEVPVIAMAQLNRGPEDRSHNRPRMSDLRESGAIEQDADVIMLLHREAYYKVGEDPAAADDTGAELIIAKQRNGPVDTIKLVFDRQTTRFKPRVAGGHYDDYPEAQSGGDDDDISFP
ncbi:MAG: replicative DNA helicase, partial [Planctomycetota bacterium]